MHMRNTLGTSPVVKKSATSVGKTGRRLVAVLLSTALSVFLVFGQASAADSCPALLQGEIGKLHSSKQIALCQQFSGKALLIVNTASYCGFTPQFKGLEKLYQQYRDQGLEIIGIPSDDFNQEDDSAEKTAAVCFKNYGVTFTMTSAQHVKGDNAHPIYRELREQSGKEPTWNFHKFLVDRQGKVRASFPSQVTPESGKLVEAVESVL